MEANAATHRASTMTTATPTTRHETLADAFLFSATESTLVVHRYHSEFYTVPFASMAWAERCGMKIVDDFSSIGGDKPYHTSPDYD